MADVCGVDVVELVPVELWVGGAAAVLLVVADATCVLVVVDVELPQAQSARAARTASAGVVRLGVCIWLSFVDIELRPPAHPRLVGVTPSNA